MCLLRSFGEVLVLMIKACLGNIFLMVLRLVLRDWIWTMLMSSIVIAHSY
ncbi:hypothetical protein NC653_026992 [Populus alba x Populus x berolinensis]|uniref:Uncharacterized protein n=1 Tax=Populus alba x Populus x berolinensis TaxID=444605 RepID=A0AAD6M5A8_9ROSI|nr:hypothetical protein NC653_026992 [Populus alba x Populus x berolinensis]